MGEPSCVRRLPVYLLLDCSASMTGRGLDDLCNGVDLLLNCLRSDPHALDTAWLSIITFARDAKQAVPLSSLEHFARPELDLQAGTALGAALQLLDTCVRREVRPTTTVCKGDYKALVFLFSDGQPTDAWEPAAERIRYETASGIANFYAIGCGPDVDSDVLGSVTDIVLRMNDLSCQAWEKVFMWISASVQTASLGLGADRSGRMIGLPDPPEDVLEGDFSPTTVGTTAPRQLFFRALCSLVGRPYLMRFARSGYGDSYAPVCSHPVDTSGGPLEGGPPTISAALLEGCPRCPYCGNPTAAVCECGALICSCGRGEVTYTCPCCGARGTFVTGMGGPLKLKQVLG